MNCGRFYFGRRDHRQNLKPQHWRGFQAKNVWEAAPMLWFVFLFQAVAHSNLIHRNDLPNGSYTIYES